MALRKNRRPKDQGVAVVGKKTGQQAWASFRVQRRLDWQETQEILASVGVQAKLERKDDATGRVELVVALPSGKEHVRSMFFAAGGNLMEEGAKAVRQALLGFEHRRGIEAEFDLQKDAPDLNALADIEASYAVLDAAAGELLRAEIAA